MNSPEDGPVGPKHVEIRQYINKIEIVTSVGFYSIYQCRPIISKEYTNIPMLCSICHTRAFHFSTDIGLVTVRVTLHANISDISNAASFYLHVYNVHFMHNKKKLILQGDQKVSVHLMITI